MSRPDLRAAAALAGDEPTDRNAEAAEAAAHAAERLTPADVTRDLAEVLHRVRAMPDRLAALRIVRALESHARAMRAGLERVIRAELDGIAAPDTALEPVTAGIVVIDCTEDN